MFNIIEFPDGVALVPAHWVCKGEKKCWWPKAGISVPNAVMKLCQPQKDWMSCAYVRILGSAASYEEGRKKLRRAEETSEVDNSTDGTKKKGDRHIRSKKRVLSSSDSGDEMDYSFHVKFPTPPDKNTQAHVVVANDDEITVGRPRSLTPMPFFSSGKGAESETYGNISATSQCQELQSGHNNFEVLVLRKLNYLCRKVEILDENLKELTKRIPDGKSDIVDLPFSLPITSLEEFNSVEDYLSSDEITKIMEQ